MESKQFTESDLVSFGNYLLSDEREKTIEREENKRLVHDCDLANWKEENVSAELMVDSFSEPVTNNITINIESFIKGSVNSPIDIEKFSNQVFDALSRIIEKTKA